MAAEVGQSAGQFLSCLHGSEQLPAIRTRAGSFLSCLHGSEREGEVLDALSDFLSCLHGSELKVNLYNLLIFKEQMPYKLEHPCF